MGMLMFSTVFTICALVFGIMKKLSNEEKAELKA
jgi:hypothetical protein